MEEAHQASTSLYLGTSVFMMHQATRYATAQQQKTIMYPAGLPAKPRNVNAWPCVSAEVKS